MGFYLTQYGSYKNFCEAKAIERVFKDLIECWKIYNADKKIPDEDVVKQINSGDCGMMAIAAYHVLKFGFGIELDICMIHNHCWLSHNNIDYDTVHPSGYPKEGAEATWLQVHTNETIQPKTRVSFHLACGIWMPCDVFGAYFIKGVISKYNVQFPVELKHILDNEEKFDSPDWIERYKNQCIKLRQR
ncbi:hypothetical protein [Aeromonas phage AerS_266]|nr:hypothetical protein [Aeromonas phage AerS_266]